MTSADGAPVPVRRARWVRPLATALVLYGLFGVLLFGLIAVSIARPLDEVEALTTSLEAQRVALEEGLKSTVDALDQAATTAQGFDASLDQSQRSAANAAGLARNVGVTMDQIAQSMRIEILGTQPLIQLVPSFETASRQLNDLGTDLDRISESLRANQAAVTGTGDRLRTLTDRVRDISELVQEGPTVEVSTRALTSIRLALYGMLAWLTMFALGCLVAGLVLWRHMGRNRLA